MPPALLYSYFRRQSMQDSIHLTLTEQFEMEKMKRVVDNTEDVKALQDLAKQLISAWHNQKAATVWAMRQNLGAPPKVEPSDILISE